MNLIKGTLWFTFVMPLTLIMAIVIGAALCAATVAVVLFGIPFFIALVISWMIYGKSILKSFKDDLIKR